MSRIGYIGLGVIFGAFCGYMANEHKKEIIGFYNKMTGEIKEDEYVCKPIERRIPKKEEHSEWDEEVPDPDEIQLDLDDPTGWDVDELEDDLDKYRDTGGSNSDDITFSDFRKVDEPIEEIFDRVREDSREKR